MTSNSNPLWFFVSESVKNEHYYVSHMKHGQFVQSNPKLSTILKLVEIKGVVDDYSFWLHSITMPAAVQLLSDESILTTGKLYCRAESIITIYVRQKSDPSPNTSRAVSHALSIEHRRKVSNIRPPEVVVREPLRNTSQSLDILSGDPVRTISVEDQVILDLGKGKTETFSKEYLKGWIAAELSRGIAPTDISVESISSAGKLQNVLLTSDIWLTSLVRGPWSSAFRDFYEQGKTMTIQRTSALEELREESDFEVKSKLFIRDLQTFSSDRSAQDRLQNTNHQFYLGQPYFDSQTIQKILALPMGNANLGIELDNLVQKKAENNEANEICASHDLAPLFGAAFGIDWKNFKKDILKEIGNLSLGEGVSSKKKGKNLKKKASNFFKVKGSGKKAEESEE